MIFRSIECQVAITAEVLGSPREFHYRDRTVRQCLEKLRPFSDYMITDITRTWPESGEFDELQRRRPSYK